MPANHVFYTGKLAAGPHQVSVRTANRAGSTGIRFGWRVVPLPAPLACQPRAGQPCWYPPHLAADHRPMRWDWQIGRTTPLKRTGKRAVDIYDIDGFLTTRAEVHAIQTRWPASTLAHPKTVCYLDLAWEDYRPDASPSPRGGYFPAATLGNVYYGYPEERWVDFRQLDALKPMLRERIGMCARKGFSAVELDDIDSFDPPSTTGFRLTPGDAQNYLAYAFNLIHADGMTGLWKNSPLLSWWGRQYSDGAVAGGVLHLPPVHRGPAARQQPVRDHLHRAVRRDAVRLGRLHHGQDRGAAHRQVGGRRRVRGRSLRLQPRPDRAEVRRQARVRGVLPGRCTTRPSASRRSSSTWTWTAGCSIPARADPEPGSVRPGRAARVAGGRRRRPGRGRRPA